MFKVGSKVYAMKNCSWGLEPMTVRIVNRAAETVSCEHPSFGFGTFCASKLKLASKVSPTRKKKLRALKKSQDFAHKELEKLFR